MSRVLVIDDDPSLRFTLEAVLSDAGFVVEACDGGASALAAFDVHGADVVLTDLAMPDMDGMQVLARLRAGDPSVPVLMLTAHGSERVAVAAMKAGAFDYIPKPFDPDVLVLAVRRATDWRDLRLQNARLRTEAALGRTIIATSPAMTRVMDMIARVAPKDVTVLLTGESGAGKDVLATVLQAHSRRADKPLVRFNAAAIPSELAEAELFGHTRGAFTGAQTARAGFFQQAHKGTLFIDEVGELPLAIQAKVLRALQSGEVQQLGGRTETVDVRLIAATAKDLTSEVRAGRFREDLFYRLNVVPIRVPPLRERPEDVEPPRPHRLQVLAATPTATGWGASRSSRRWSKRCVPTRGRATCASSRTRWRACSPSRPTSESPSPCGVRCPTARPRPRHPPRRRAIPGPDIRYGVGSKPSSAGSSRRRSRPRRTTRARRRAASASRVRR